MKILLGSVLLDHNEAKEEVFLMLDELQLSMKNLEKHLNRIEYHLGLPPYPAYVSSMLALLSVPRPRKETNGGNLKPIFRYDIYPYQIIEGSLKDLTSNEVTGEGIRC